MDSLTSLSPADQTDPCAGVNEREKPDGETHEEAPVGEETVAVDGDENKLDPVTAEKEKEEGEDLATDRDSSAASSVSNRFTVLSEEQHSKDSVLDDDKMSDMEQEAEEDTELVSEMGKVTLDDAFIENSDAVEQGMELEEEEEPLEGKEYTVVNQDPELAFHTLATRTAPEKSECSVQSCLFQFTEVETLTQNNSLLCVTCTKRQGNKDKAGGVWNFSAGTYLFHCYSAFVPDTVKTARLWILDSTESNIQLFFGLLLSFCSFLFL